jgi:uncharacterized protein DUF5691
MLDAASLEALTRSVVVGTARRSLPVEGVFGAGIEPTDPKAALKALALLGQHTRFVRRWQTAPIPTEPLFPDDRPTMPEAARPLLISLCGRKADARDTIAFAIAEALERKALSIHRFDLPRLDAFVKEHAEQLGGRALAWTDRRARGAAIGRLDETNWTLGGAEQKADFIRKLRGTDPARARELVEAAFPTERAAVRVRLVAAFHVNLSPADAAFLEKAATDRDGSVQATATNLLDELPGSAAAAKRRQEALSRIKVTRSGLLRRRTTIALDYPANVSVDLRPGWAFSAFQTTTVDDVAQAVGLRVEDIADAAAQDLLLLTVLAVRAMHAMRFDLVARLVRAGAAWRAMIENLAPHEFGAAWLQDWSAAAIQPGLWDKLPDTAALKFLCTALRAPLSEAIARNLLESNAWRSFVDPAREQAKDAAEQVVMLAVLMPTSLRPALRADLARLAATINTTRALDAMTLLDLIETA